MHRVKHWWLLVMLMGLAGCNLGPAAPATQPFEVVPQSADETLVVAWVDAGNLVVWQTGDTLPRRIASGGVVQPFIAPDGTHVVFTRGANGTAETLWVVDTDGTAEQQLVGERPASYTPDVDNIGDVRFLNSQTVLFNTLSQETIFYTPQNDLYYVDIVTRELALLRVSGDGGRVTVAPNGERIATVYHGTYGSQDAVIRVEDVRTLSDVRSDDLLFFTGVATGAEYAFYPTLHWLPDSSAVLVSIPDADLIYSETSSDPPQTALWRLPVTDPGERELLGSVTASFFGLPRWNDAGTQLLYLQRAVDSNQITAFVADADGSNPTVIYSGSLEQLTSPEWVPDSEWVVFARPTAAGDGTQQYFTRTRDTEATLLSEQAIYALQFVSAVQYVYVTPGNRRIDMRVGDIDGNSIFIGSLNAVPIYDAVLVRD